MYSWFLYVELNDNNVTGWNYTYTWFKDDEMVMLFEKNFEWQNNKMRPSRSNCIIKICMREGHVDAFEDKHF